MPVQFPVTCKLMDHEKRTLTAILADDESPCDGCAWTATCDGPEAQQKIETMLFEDPDNHCLVCGHPTMPPNKSKLISGAFRFCSVNSDEYVFTPDSCSVDADSESVEF